MASPSTGEQPDNEATNKRINKTKVIQFLGRNTLIVLQKEKENGSSAFLAICNVLLLKNTMHLSLDLSEISEEDLIKLVVERLINSLSNAEGYPTADQKKIDETTDLVPLLTTGMNMNVKFTGITDFEFKRESELFDILGIRLYHGWLVDPQDKDIVAAIGQKFYDTLMDEVVTRSSAVPSSPLCIGSAVKGELIKNFLDKTANQLTSYGLFRLKEDLTEGELCVLFRNNHFNTMHKFEGKLYLLATDEGYLSQPDLAWEKLNQVNGNISYATGTFKDLSRDGQNASAKTSSKLWPGTDS